MKVTKLVIMKGGYMTLKGLRVSAGLSQAEVAKNLNLTTLTYRRKEQGEYEFKFNELIKLCSLLDVDLNQLVDSMSEYIR